MQQKRNNDWLLTSEGKPRGYIHPQSLTELWFHTGTACNLSCPFCLEGSKPGDHRIQYITLDEAKRFIDEALELGVNKFSFTGGEPFVNPHMFDILDYALDHRPCLVLTNATEPLMNRFARIQALKDKPNLLSLRVSLDHPDPVKHDEARGKGNFAKALKTLGHLYKEGLGVSIARLIEDGEDSDAIVKSYLPFFRDAGLPDNLTIIRFPDFLTPGALPEVPQITTHCMTTHLTEKQRSEFMCNFSKMIVKKDGACGVYPCTLVDDDEDYNLAPTLRESMDVRVMLRHHRCYSCFAFGASCSEGH